MAEGDPQVGIGIDADEAEARQEFDRIALIMQRSLERVGPTIGRSIGRSIASELGRNLSAEQAGLRGLRQSAEQAAAGLRAGAQASEEFNRDINALNERVEATRRTLSQVGAQPELFSVVNAELEKVLRLQAEFNRDVERISTDPTLLRGYEVAFQNARVTIGREVTSINQELRSLAAQQKTQGNLAVESLRGQNNIRKAELERARGEFVATTQREGAQILAETRAQAAEQLQTQRATSRRRIEILRFTLNQVRVLERGIGAAFRASAAVIAGTFARVEGAVFRIGRLFRRSNNELNDGLRGALLTRERSIERSFSRQTADIRQATFQQGRLFDRLERQASTGIAGAVTGRSRLGALVGGGAAVGGGFIIARNLREGFEESVNLQESLNKTRQIFQDAADEVVAFSENSVDALFVTQSQALEAASNFGIFGKAAGLSGTELAQFSQRLSLLATDLASFNNTSIQDATTAISAALRGESEPIRRFGVLLNEATLQQRAFSLGITDTIRQLQPFERVLAANAEILAQTRDQQGDAARTANDFANSSRRAGAAATEAFAAIAGKVVPLATIITNVAFPALQAFTRFIEGDVSPALQVLRRGLIGAGAALSLLLAARAAGEAVRFLGIALRFTVTPLGLFITSVAAVGAAIAIFTERSERFADGVQSITSAARAIGGRVLGVAVDALSALGEIIQTRVLPAAERLASVVAGPLRRGIEIGFGFILNVAVPAAQRLAEIVTTNLVPALEFVGRVLRDRVLPPLAAFGGAVVSVLGGVLRVVEPAIAGFLTLGSAIRRAFQGDTSGLLDGLRAAAAGIGAVFVGIGESLVRFLRPAVTRAVAFIVDAFQGLDLAAIGTKILEVVRLVGFVLGSIVSDPRFIQALEAIVAAAVLVGGNFVIGFAQGVASNLPELVSLLGGQLRTAFAAALEFAFDNPGLIASILFGALAARSVLNAFQTAGQRGAGALVRGFVPAVRRGIDRDTGFLAGFFGSPGAIERQADRAARRATRAFQSRIDRANRDINRLGSVGLIPIEIDEAGARQVERRLDQVKRQFTDISAEAILTGARTREVFRGAAGVAGGFATVLRGDVRNGFALAGAGAQTFGRAVVEQFRGLQAAGRLSGAALGNSVLAGFGAVIAGQQLGQGNTAIGLTGILASAIGAGLATGSPLVGAAVGGIGLISAALSASGEEARIAAEKVNGYVDALRNVSGTEALSVAAERINAALTDQDEAVRDLLLSAGFTTQGFTESALSGTASIEQVASELGAALGLTSDQVDRFLALRDQLNAENDPLFGDRIQGVLDGVFGAGTLDTDLIRDEFQKANVDADAFAAALEALFDESSAVQGALDKLDFSQAISGVRELSEEGQRRFDGFVRSLEDTQRAQERLGNNRGVIQLGQDYQSASDVIVSSLGDAGQATLDFLGIDFDSFLDNLGNFDFAAFQRTYNAAITGISENTQRLLDNTRLFVSATGSTLNDIALDLLNASNTSQGAANDLYDAFDFDELDLSELLGIDDLDSDLTDLAPTVDLVGEAIESLNSKRTNRINSEIAGVRDQLSAAETAANDARSALTDYLTGRYADTAQASVDALIGNVGSIGSEIEEALQLGGVRGDAALRSAVGGFESELARIIQAGFDDGLRTPEEFRRLLAPLSTVIDEEVGDAAARILSTVDFDSGFNNRAAASLREVLERAVSDRDLDVGVRSIFNADAEVARLQSQLDSLQLQLDTDVIFDAAQIQQALTQAGLDAGLLQGLDLSNLESRQTGGLSGAVSEFEAQQAAQQAAQDQQNFDVAQAASQITVVVQDSGNPRATGREVVLAAAAASTGPTRVSGLGRLSAV